MLLAITLLKKVKVKTNKQKGKYLINVCSTCCNDNFVLAWLGHRVPRFLTSHYYSVSVEEFLEELNI